MTIVITCAGALGYWVYPRNSDEQEQSPEALISVAGKPLVQWAVESIGWWPEPVEFLFLALARHEEEYDLTSALRPFMQNRFRVLTLHKRGHGQLATAMLASGLFSDGSPLIVASCNIFVRSDFREHIKRMDPNVRAIVVTQPTDPAKSLCDASEWHVLRFGYSAPNMTGPDSPAGIYYFRDGREFANAGSAAVVAAAYASRSCPMTDAIELYERHGWTVEKCAVRESWPIKDRFRAKIFERHIFSGTSSPGTDSRL